MSIFPPLCAFCVEPMERKPKGGRRKVYCSDKCRRDAWAQRKEEELLVIARSLWGRKKKEATLAGSPVAREGGAPTVGE